MNKLTVDNKKIDIEKQLARRAGQLERFLDERFGVALLLKACPEMKVLQFVSTQPGK